MTKRDDTSALRRQVRELSAAVEARDRILRDISTRPKRRRAGDDDAQPLLVPRQYPLTAFAMGPGRRIRLPETLRDIAEVIGREAAVRLAEGMRPIEDDGAPASTGARPWRKMIYVPRRLTPEHPLVGLLGWQTALKLQRSHTNMILEIPFCADLVRAYRDHIIAEMARGGFAEAEIASWVQLHLRSVRNIISREEIEIAPEEPVASRGQR